MVISEVRTVLRVLVVRTGVMDMVMKIAAFLTYPVLSTLP